jgi:His/Glu/Gln/Arg/opine family amino acid ABC transporter permease subunit
MGYTLNFTLIWRHFDKLWIGLLTSLELALFAISVGIVIGLVLAIVHVSGGRLARALISAYVEFIRNVPLLLLVYLVFYGLPTAVDISYDATTSFVVTLSLYRPDALAAVDLRATSHDAPHNPASPIEHFHILVQGHLGRFCDRSP